MKEEKIKKLKKELEDLEKLKKCAERFNLLGDHTRLKICYLLCKHKELTVSEIAEIVGVSISAVSHTLKKLKEAKIVKSRRKFRNVFYSLTNKKIKKIISYGSKLSIII